MENQIVHTTGQDTFEFGKAGSRQTLRFVTPDELDAKVKRLRELGYISEEGEPCIPKKNE